MNERYNVNYVKENETVLNHDEIIYNSNCFPIEQIRKKKSWIHKEIKFVLEDLYNEIFKFLDRKIKNKKLRKLIAEIKQTKSYMIFDNNFCLIANNGSDGKFIWDNLNLNSLTCFLFKTKPFTIFYFCEHIGRIKQLKIINLEAPYSDCQKEESKFLCINQCLKERHRSLRYYYR